MPDTVQKSDKSNVSLRERRRAEVRRLFIEAAADAFGTNGYAGTSVDDIARAAGTTRTTFYFHFSGKADLIGALLETVAEDTVGRQGHLTEAVAQGSREAIASWLDTTFDSWERLSSYVRAEDEAAILHPEVKVARDEVFDGGVAAIVAGLERAGRTDPDTRTVRAVLAYTQLQSLFRRWLRMGWDIDRPDTLAVMSDTWWRLLNP